MKIELRNVQYVASMSEETRCFTASIYVDGKRAGEASNRGHGGPTSIHPRELEERLNAYAATLPPLSYDMGGRTHTMPQTGEILVDELLSDWLTERDLRTALKRRILFTKQGQTPIYETKSLPKATLEQWTRNPEKARATLRDCDQILNCLPFAEALAIYRQAVEASAAGG